MIKKYKTEIIIFLIGFLLYFTIGTIITYYLNTMNFWSVLFDLDSPRVFGDLTLINYNHYRTAVHPLFVILFQPITLIISKIINNPVLSVLSIQSFFASLTLAIFYDFIKKINNNQKLCFLFTILFGLSFAQILFSAAIETYIFAQLFLILLWLFTINNLDKNIDFKKLVILTILGVFSLGITITNFVQFLIVIYLLVFLNKKIEDRIFKGCSIIIISIIFTVFLANVQNIIWPSAPNFFSKGINDLIYGNSEEKLYINFKINLSNLMNVMNSNFAYDFNFFKFIIPYKGAYITFKNSIISNIISITFFILFIFSNTYFIFKIKKYHQSHKLYFGLLIGYFSNFCFHLVYGNSTSFLYICNYNFILLFIIYYIVSNLNLFKKISLPMYFSIIGIYIALALKNIIGIILTMLPLYNPISHFCYYPIILLSTVVILLIIILIKNKIFKLLLLLLIIISPYFIHKILNDSITNGICKSNCNSWELAENSLKKYENQIKEMRNNFMVTNFIDTDEKLSIFYFGMANRPKLLYKNGKIFDIYSHKELFSFDYEEQLIVPNEYMVLLKDKKNNVYKIFENEHGIYIETNNEVKTIFENNKEEINLPKFENNKYSEILRVLHQEILFNIDGFQPRPNIIGYDKTFYRDAMLGTMVLEKTNNTKLFEPWVFSINSIYDYARSKNIKETDNLGELLYIIGAVKIDRKDLVEKIINEINNITNSNNYICGYIDGTNQCYYPTALALYGAKKLNIELNLTLPKQDDCYAKLTWYYNKDFQTKKEIDNNYYPYLNWAFYNYGGYGKLYMLDENYPLTYEAADISNDLKNDPECFISNFYCQKGVHLSHMWHASEMFLYLINY
jgi:hypothetical protein